MLSGGKDAFLSLLVIMHQWLPRALEAMDWLVKAVCKCSIEPGVRRDPLWSSFL